MGLTAFSFILLPLCFVWAMSPGRLLKTMAIASVFEAAAAVTLGSFGVQPGLVPALGFIAFMLLQLLLGARFAALPAVWNTTRPFVVMTVWAVIASFVMPRAFEGQVFVWPQRATLPYVIVPLEPSPTNINQDIYLILNCMFLVLAAIYLARPRLSLGPFINIYLVSGFVVAAVAAWQFASRVAGVPYPEDLFYSNPGWAILTEQSIGAVPRINGPFSEPSSLGGYMASIVCAAGWMLLRGRRNRMLPWLVIVGLLSMALSTSTTGFAVLAIVCVLVPSFALLRGSVRLMAQIMKIAVPVALCGAVLFFTASLLVPSFQKNVTEVIEGTLNKKQSSSYEDRTGTDLDSLTAMVDTYGLGVGWGSNRSSSLLPGLLAQVGIPGILCLGWFGLGLSRQVSAAHRLGCTAEQSLVLDGCCGGIVGFLLGALISAPTINSMTFFFLLALLIGCSTQVRLEAQVNRRRAAARSPTTRSPATQAAVRIGVTGLAVQVTPL